MTTTFHVRLPVKLKKQAQKIAEMNGADLGTIVRMFFTQMVHRGTVPMRFLTINGFTPEFEAELYKLSEDTANIVGPFHSKKKLLESIYDEDSLPPTVS